MDLAAAVHRAVETARPLIEARRHHLQVVAAAARRSRSTATSRASPRWCSNLLNNAAKYTPEGGRIARRAAARRTTTRVLRVSDNGIGIPPELLERVFDLFAQGERTLDRAAGGLGIGLTLARRIVALHGGTITRSSAGRARARRSRCACRASTRERRAAGAGRQRAREPATGPRALDPRRRRQRRLRRRAWRCCCACSATRSRPRPTGRAALERIRGHAPDIVLLDIGLPGMSGYEVAQGAARAIRGRAALRLYAMTGYGQEEDRRRSPKRASTATW